MTRSTARPGFRPRKPPITSPVKLRAYSDEHVAYEVSMFFGAVAARRAQFAASDIALGHFVDMAIIEAFAIHLRNLVAFCYPDSFRAFPDDVLAHHFIASSSPFAAWAQARPQLTTTLRRAKERADREMGHLSRDRIAGRRPRKTWDFPGLAYEARTLLAAFVNVADPARLSDRVAAAIPTSETLGVASGSSDGAA
jgi:hypothetical protein